VPVRKHVDGNDRALVKCWGWEERKL